MKTFTNLIKRASLSTFNKKRYYLFIIMLLTLGIGSAWAAENVTVTKTTNTLVSELSWSVSSGSDCAGCYTNFDLNEAISISTTGTPNCGSVWGTTTNDWRLYQNQNGNVTVSAKDGYELVSIKYTYSQSNSGTLKDGSTTIATKTVVDCSGLTTKTLTVGNTGTKTNGQVRITEFSVTYVQTSAGGDEPPTPTTQYTVKWYTALGTSTDVTLEEGATITKPATKPEMSGYAFMGWTDQCSVAEDGTGFTALTDFGTADADKEFYAVFAVATTTGGGGSATTVTDVLTRATTGVTNTSYASWSEKTATSSAVYAGQSAGGNESIQLRSSNSNSGVVTTASGGKAKKVTIVWNSNTSSGRIVDIYGKNSAYSQATDLYNATNQGTKLGSIKYGESTELTISGDYEYIGLRSNSGAMYLTSISIDWETAGGGGSTTYNNYITTCSGATVAETLTDAQFAWSAATAEATMGATNTFPTLTNTLGLTVTYESSTPATATIATDGTITLVAPGTTTISAKFAGGEVSGTTYAAKTVEYTLTVKKAPLAPIAGGVIDILNQEWTDVSGTNYKDVAEKTAENAGHSNAKYVAQCAGDKSSIQLRSNNSNSGVVSTVSGGIVKRVEVEWQNETSSGRVLQIYGSNTAYTAATDLYDDAKKGTLLGEVTMGGDETVVDYTQWTGDYKYIGFRSKSGAMYLTTVTITWLPTISKVTIADPIENGSVSVSGAADLNSVVAGTVLTLTATPVTDYKLSAYDVYKTDDATVKVTVTDGKFVMPEYDVTISATFEAAKTLTSIEITTAATQTTFWQGETFNSTGLVVTAHFDGAEDEVVTPTVTGSTATAGTQTVTVSYTEGTVTKSTTYEITVKATANTEATAYDVVTAREIIDKVSTANDIYVTGIVSEIVTAYNSTYGNITYNISADGLTTSVQLQAFRGKSFNGDNFTSANDVKVGDEVVVFGNLLKYDSTYELAADNKLISLNRNKAAAGLAFETTEYTANVNEAFAAPTLTNPNSLAVTYSTSDATLATVDAATGAVTILDKTGKVTITATFAGNESYLYGTASYNITISDPSLTEATFDATVDLGNTTKGEGSIAKSPITFACTDGVLGNGSEYRLYKDAKITFTAENGYAITKVVLTSTASGTSQYGPGLLSAEEGTYSYSDKTGTWVGEAQTVTLTATAQSRATLITVYYKTDNRQDAGLAWSTENMSITLGDTYTLPTLSNPNGLSIECSSDNEDLATVTNAGAITLKSGVTGKATITAKFDGNSDYKDATVTCTITVNPKTETVVILAQYNGQWYALKNVEETAGKVLAALPVNYVGGKLYNVEEADKTTIEWQRAAVTDGIIFKNGENYIYGTAGSTDLKLSTTECAWTLDGTTYKLGNRTFFYNETANGFKNYNTSNAGNSGYSNLPVVTAPVYATGDAYGRSVNLGEDGYRYGTICLPFGSTNFTGAEFFECVGKEEGKVYIASVTTLVAGTPYIFLASATEVAVYGNGTTAATAGDHNGLYGTFNNETVVAANEDNHILLNNELCKVAETCWVNANRAYLVMSEVPAGAPQQMPGRRYIGMSTKGENAETGLENIIVPEGQAVKVISNGQLIIIRDGEMYNAQGQRL